MTAIKNEMFGNPYGSRNGFGVRIWIILDLVSVTTYRTGANAAYGGEGRERLDGVLAVAQLLCPGLGRGERVKDAEVIKLHPHALELGLVRGQAGGKLAAVAEVVQHVVEVGGVAVQERPALCKCAQWRSGNEMGFECGECTV